LCPLKSGKIQDEKGRQRKVLLKQVMVTFEIKKTSILIFFSWKS
jgi:hypothetical protein